MLIGNIPKHIFHYVWKTIQENYGLILKDFLNLMNKLKKLMMITRMIFFVFVIFNIYSCDFSVLEVEQTRSDGNIIKVTEYDLSKEKFDPRISDAVRTHSDKVDRSSRRSHRHSRAESRIRSPPSPIPER
jgi:hypothetical protein